MPGGEKRGQKMNFSQKKLNIYRFFHDLTKLAKLEKINSMDTNPQVVFSWEAPLRAYKKTSTGVLRFYVAIALLLSLIVFFWGEKILVLPIWAVLFLFYVFTITVPPIVKNQITTFGIEGAEHTYRFEALARFYFTKRFDYYVLVIVGKPPFNYHMYFVVPDDETKKKVTEILSDHIMYQEYPEKTAIDRMIGLLSSLMPEA